LALAKLVAREERAQLALATNAAAIPLRRSALRV